jgi:hypothetical protein
MYSWLTGVLSGILDNVRTYLIFFNRAGGDARGLRPALSITLLAISAGLFLWTQIPISQPAKLHGEVNRRAAQRANAELFWLYAVVCWVSVAVIRPTDNSVFHAFLELLKAPDIDAR